MIRHVRLALLLAVGWAGAAQALTCTVSSGMVAFGAYDPVTAGAVLTTGNISVTCNGSFHIQLSAGLGNGAGASYLNGRKMTRASGGGTLTYNLYADAARSKVLGNGTGGSVRMVIDDKKGTHSKPIWARIPGGQTTALSGDYSDILVVTIAY